MAELVEYLNRRLGFQLFPSTAQRDLAISIIEARNLIAHNGGIVNDTFLRRVKESPWKLGDRIVFQFAEHLELLTFLDESVSDIDSRAVAKWGLPTCQIRVGGEEGPQRIDVSD